MGCVSIGQETEYRELADRLLGWCKKHDCFHPRRRGGDGGGL